MKLKRRDRIALIIFAVALLALAVDKFILPPPEGALAAESIESTKAPRIPPDLSAELRKPSPIAPPASATKPAPPPNVFDWGRLGAVVAAPVAAEMDASMSELAANLQLEATVLGPNPVAVIDGRTYRRGDRIGDLVLETITLETAEFVGGGQRFVLRIPKRGTRKP